MNPSRALSLWGLDVPIRTSPDEGLINHTWLVGEPPCGVLQWVNPIVDPLVHKEIAHITAQLQASGIPTPHLLPTLEGAQWVVQPDGCWRMLSFVPGSTFDAFSSPAQASSAAALVGRFHAALAEMTLEFPHQRLHAHNTVAHMASLDQALSGAEVHPLGRMARAIGHEILEAWEHWEGPLELPTRVCHGDLKVSNIRMDHSGQVAVCLLDLDTLGRLPYSVELGDAWRSWCNPAPEDDFEHVRFDLEIFTATARAWLAHAPPLAEIERASLVPGIQRICLELAARFCGDAVRNSYFREDTQRYPEPGSHNLARAKTQLALAAAAHDQAGACEAVIAAAAQHQPAAG